ncbi:neuropeptide Y receptor type 2 [Xenopus tropicalis]|uniref:Neuropeptide Y receptor type 2 n=1 Tax=Xenopus tropicalis TaxID=8364 RepID=A0A6I8PTM4_XENTR|nr:neuropeptide Y receptor type 2 [Xenopus tropicalis]|eukprot:XP_017948295.1 PREDICTED: neuropeptide Y receptor type 2-like [Xenopus tropicalis]
MGTLKQTNPTEELGSRGLHSKSMHTFHGAHTIMMDYTKLVGVQVILIAAYSLIILLGLVGNSLVIYMIVKYKNMRTVTNFFIANLAIADLMVDSFCLPFTLVYTLMDEWKFGSVLCHLFPYAQAMSVNVSTLTLIVIALDRYWCIVFHLNSRISKNLSFLIISITWITAAILAIPLAVFREFRYEDLPPFNLKIAVCAENWTNRDSTIYSLSMLILQYALPLAVICYAYLRIWFKLKNHISPTTRSESQQRRKNTTKMLVMMVVVFAVCWLPFHIFQLAIDLEWTVAIHENKLLYTIFHVVAMCSTFVNPFLYGWMNKNYRHGFLTFFGCKDTLQNSQPDGSLRGHSYTFRPTTFHGSIKHACENGNPPTHV